MKRDARFCGGVWVGAASFLVALFFSSASLSADVRVADPLAQAKASLEASRSLSDYTAVLVKQERFGRKLASEEQVLFKYANPDRVYMRWVGKVNKGQEALYVKGQNEDRLKAHKGGFLGLVTVNVDPLGKMAREGQQHPIFHAGIGATTELVIRDLKKGLGNGEVTVSGGEKVTLDGREVMKVEALFPETLAGVTHSVKKGETLWDIAASYDQDMFVIQHVNDGVGSPGDIKAGQDILVPSYYCRRSTTYFDVVTNLLIKIEIYDWDDNLYESYHYRDLKLNVGLNDSDFDPDNKNYKF